MQIICDCNKYVFLTDHCIIITQIVIGEGKRECIIEWNDKKN